MLEDQTRIALNFLRNQQVISKSAVRLALSLFRGQSTLKGYNYLCGGVDDAKTLRRRRPRRSNHILSLLSDHRIDLEQARSKIGKTDTLSRNFFKENCVLP